MNHRFALREKLTSNDYETYYRAWDQVLRREVVLKVTAHHTKPLGVELNHRCLREARDIAKVDHPGIVRLFDVMEVADGFILVMEPLTGESLAMRLTREGELSVKETCSLGAKLADALAAVHRAGIVHRGIATSNVILKPDGQPVIVGFLFAKFTDPGNDSSSIDYHYNSPVVVGSVGGPRNPSPEQVHGGVADVRSDILGLGCVLYESLTLQHPFPVPIGSRRNLRGPSSRGFQKAEQLRDLFRQKTDTDLAPVRRQSNAYLLAPVLAAIVLCSIPLFLIWDGSDEAHEPQSSIHRGAMALDNVGHHLPHYESSHALLIGIGDCYREYGHPPLKNAETDMAAISGLLQAMTWENWRITQLLGKEAIRDSIMEALVSLAAESKPDDRVLVYYAGHGQIHPDSPERGWIVPAGAPPAKEDPSRKTWIPSTSSITFSETPKRSTSCWPWTAAMEASSPFHEESRTSHRRVATFRRPLIW